MSKYLFGELHILGISVILGGIISAVYDVFRILRRVIRHGVVAVSVEDFVFAVFCAVLIFYEIIIEQQMSFRAYVFFGILAGAFLYNFLAGRFIVTFFAKILKKMTKILNSLLKKLCKFIKINVFSVRMDRVLGNVKEKNQSIGPNRGKNL